MAGSEIQNTIFVSHQSITHRDPCCLQKLSTSDTVISLMTS